MVITPETKLVIYSTPLIIFLAFTALGIAFFGLGVITGILLGASIVLSLVAAWKVQQNYVQIKQEKQWLQDKSAGLEQQCKRLQQDIATREEDNEKLEATVQQLSKERFEHESNHNTAHLELTALKKVYKEQVTQGITRIQQYLQDIIKNPEQCQHFWQNVEDALYQPEECIQILSKVKELESKLSQSYQNYRDLTSKINSLDKIHHHALELLGYTLNDLSEKAVAQNTREYAEIIEPIRAYLNASSPSTIHSRPSLR